MMPYAQPRELMQPQNQALLSSSLQTAHNLRLLPDLVSNLLADLNDAVTIRIQRAFDSVAIGKEVAGKGVFTRRDELTLRFHISISYQIHVSRPSCHRAELVEQGSMDQSHVGETCTGHGGRRERLHQSLHPGKGAQVEEGSDNECRVPDRGHEGGRDKGFIGANIVQSLDERPSFTFWTTLAQAFESQTKEAARCGSISKGTADPSASAWLQQALSSGYPRLLRLFHDFFAKIAVHTDTVYTTERQR